MIIKMEQRKRKESYSGSSTGSSLSRSNKLRSHIILGAIIVTLVLFIIGPHSTNQQVEAKKLKEKKVLKSIVKSLIFKNLSTKKNFLAMPVPIPVPIELSEPPVYLKGKPKYVTIYKAKPEPQVVKPTTVYHMPVYSPTYEYMMTDPVDLYGGMMSSNLGQNSYRGLYGSSKLSSSKSTNFNDFDDEFGSYYLSKSASSYRRQDKSSQESKVHRADNVNEITWLLPTEEEESLDNDDESRHKRVKRQIYHESSYENEQPCYGFPLEINIRSRIKPDQLFPIHGKSQFKKCIKLPKRPLLPPVEDAPSPY